MLEKINYGITNFMDNKAGEYIATSLSESSEEQNFILTDTRIMMLLKE